VALQSEQRAAIQLGSARADQPERSHRQRNKSSDSTRWRTDLGDESM
jgi:hypothetical protein